MSDKEPLNYDGLSVVFFVLVVSLVTVITGVGIMIGVLL